MPNLMIEDSLSTAQVKRVNVQGIMARKRRRRERILGQILPSSMVMLWDSIRIMHIKMSLVITRSIVRVPILRVKVPIVPGVKTDNKLKLQTWARETSQ